MLSPKLLPPTTSLQVPYECLANHYFSGDMVGENTMLVFKEGSLYLTNLVPEPTTATLSLLALAALAARRRRS